jgi:hypothetical protein
MARSTTPATASAGTWLAAKVARSGRALPPLSRAISARSRAYAEGIPLASSSTLAAAMRARTAAAYDIARRRENTLASARKAAPATA